MEFTPQDARGPLGAAPWKLTHLPPLDDDELAEILLAGTILPGVEHTLRRLLDLELAEDDNLFC